MTATPIKDEFERFMAQVVGNPADMTDAERQDLRGAFWAGANVMFTRIMESAGNPELLATMDAELEAFTAELKRARDTAPQTPTIVILPGSPDDPDRNECFRGMQLACAGAKVASVLTAHIDSLGVVIAASATDRANADALLETTGRDLRKAVDDNWDLVREQMAQTAPGNREKH